MNNLKNAFMSISSLKLICLLILLNAQISYSGYVLTFGPVGHFNYKLGITSVGFEIGYWPTGLIGLDLGFETFKYDSKRSSFGDNFIIYSEFQLSALVVGTSLGPYVKYQKDESEAFTFGLQNTNWFWFFVGGYHRLRFENNEYNHFLGGFFKFPYLVGDSPYKINLGGP